MDIKIFRTKEGIELIKQSQKARFIDNYNDQVDQIVELDSNIIHLEFIVNGLNKQQNLKTKEIKQFYTNKSSDTPITETTNVTDLIVESKNLAEQSKTHSEELKLKREKLQKLLSEIGNLIHPSVPISDTEKENEIIKCTDNVNTKTELTHDKVLLKLNGFDPKRGSTISGHRGYFLRDIGVFLNQALINYAIQFLSKRGYTTLQTPFMMRDSELSKVAQLSEYQESLYEIKSKEDNRSFLIATSEQPLTAFHSNEILKEEELPLKYCGYSTCFRKEAGSYGKDNLGIFRVHQFEKIEQFCICKPEDSWKIHEEMLQTSMEFLDSLNIPYRVVNIVSKELNNAAAKKYDIEGWFPGMNEFKELVSCTNCTDYQSKKVNTTFDLNKKIHVHMLNATLCATTRVICAILENNQTDTGVKIPKQLQKYLQPFVDNPEFIEFIN